MPQCNIKVKGLPEMERAIRRNPSKTLKELNTFFVRALAEYRKSIMQAPWKIGLTGGGAPVETGHLKGSHQSIIKPTEASIAPDRAYNTTYAPYVHGIEGHPRKRNYKLRPWMDHAFKKKSGRIEQLSNELLKNIVADLAK